jgi:hypothetical protein
MTERIRFYMDEQVPRAVTEGLRRRGVDVLTAQEAGLIATPDEKHLAYAFQQHRVLFTQDTDFLHLHTTTPDHCGIAYAHQQRPVGYIVRGLMLIYEVLSLDEMAGQVEFL